MAYLAQPLTLQLLPACAGIYLRWLTPLGVARVVNSLTWLLAKLRRIPTPSGLTPPPSELTPAPVSPPAPLTKAEREARQQQRALDFERAFVEDFTQALRESHSMADEPPAELLRAMCMLRYNRADQEQAR